MSDNSVKEVLRVGNRIHDDIQVMARGQVAVKVDAAAGHSKSASFSYVHQISTQLDFVPGFHKRIQDVSRFKVPHVPQLDIALQGLVPSILKCGRLPHIVGPDYVVYLIGIERSVEICQINEFVLQFLYNWKVVRVVEFPCQ